MIGEKNRAMKLQAHLILRMLHRVLIFTIEYLQLAPPEFVKQVELSINTYNECSSYLVFSGS